VIERGATGLQLARSRAEPIIARLPSAVTAFVGRTLKGPVHRPVAVASFADFQQVFGGLWQPSSLSYAVEQFFDHGGSRALIVRVANGARPPTITLPAGAGALRLVGVNPGSREYLRASVDYDGIPEGDSDRFNLVVHRVRSAGSELIEDQEIVRRASLRPDSGRFLPDLLLHSRLVRALEPLPEQRPVRSAGPGGSPIGYALSNPDGDDGGPLTDYDIIGSAAAATGLFALSAAEGFNFLCIPPLARERDVGLSALLVAARYCRERHAMLIVDPPASWTTPRAALDGMRAWPFRSDNAVMYFPRVQALDRLRGRVETFASCGAVAGMLARSDETSPLWSSRESEETMLRPGTQPSVSVCDADRLRLAQVGINTLRERPAAPAGGGGVRLQARTLAAGGSGFADWKYLSARRLGLWVAASIERGTRWVLLEQNAAATWGRARSLVETFLEVLAEQGAFAGAEGRDRYFVICDERVNRPDTIADGRINLLFGFATGRPGEFEAWLVTHHPTASRVRPVSVNRLATSRERVEWEIETTILKKIDYR
jgi:phage tail sheath protein FI